MPIYENDTQQAEAAFDSLIGTIPGVNTDRLEDWKAHARYLADADAEALTAQGFNASADACYRKLLGDFGSLFQEMEQKYAGSAAAIINYRAEYLPNELLPAADWIHNGGTVEEAHEMADAGAFELGAFVSRGAKVLTQAELDAMHARHTLYELDQPDGVRADFSGQVLDGLFFDGMSFPCASFIGAAVERCSMDGGSFIDCNFRGAHFYDVTARYTDFDGSKFIGASLEKCVFTQAILQRARFEGASIESCKFDQADMEGVDFSQTEAAHTTGLGAFAKSPEMKMGGG